MATEKRLIDADALIERVRQEPTDGMYTAEIVEVIGQMPTVDAVPAVPGKWIPRIDNDTPMHECSVCGARVVKGLYEYENPNLFCYHCGAKMDGERKDNAAM